MGGRSEGQIQISRIMTKWMMESPDGKKSSGGGTCFLMEWWGSKWGVWVWIYWIWDVVGHGSGDIHFRVRGADQSPEVGTNAQSISWTDVIVSVQIKNEEWEGKGRKWNSGIYWNLRREEERNKVRRWAAQGQKKKASGKERATPPNKQRLLGTKAELYLSIGIWWSLEEDAQLQCVLRMEWEVTGKGNKVGRSFSLNAKEREVSSHRESQRKLPYHFWCPL